VEGWRGWRGGEGGEGGEGGGVERVERSETGRGETEMEGVSQSAAMPLTVKGSPSCLASFPGTWE